MHDKLKSKDNNITTKDYASGEKELKGTYKIDGKEYGFTIDDMLNVKLGDIEQTIEEAFNMTVTNVDKTSLRATGDEAKLNELGTTEYTYVASTSTGDIKYEHITTTSYDVTGLEPDTEYTVYMLAYDNAGNVKKSNEVTVTTKKLEIVTTDSYIGTSTTITDATKSVADNSQTRGTTLYINFTATLEGTACTVKLKDGTDTDKLPYAITKNGTYTFVVTGTYGNNKTITKEIEVKVNKYEVATGLVKYDAGDWTEDEINALKAKSLYNINTEKVASADEGLNFTFGGFTYAKDSAGNVNTTYANEIRSGTVITSRNQSVAPQINSGTPAYDGWQILEIKDSTGNKITNETEISNKLNNLNSGEKVYVTKLVHAGSPENFVYDWAESYDNRKAEYILSGGTRQTSYNTYQPRDWSMYADKNLKAKGYIDEVHAMTYYEALAVTGIINTTNGLRNTKADYWLASAYHKGGESVWNVEDGGYIGSTARYCWGVRPVVSLASGVYIASGNGTAGNEYVLGKD